MRKGRELFLWGLVFLLIVLALPSHDRFQFHFGGRQTIITRPQRPFAFWSAEGVVIVVSLALVAVGLHRSREP
jgi:hypothetical protein